MCPHSWLVVKARKPHSRCCSLSQTPPIIGAMWRRARNLKMHQKDLIEGELFSHDVASLQVDAMTSTTQTWVPRWWHQTRNVTPAFEQVFYLRLANSNSFDVVLKQEMLFFPVYRQGSGLEECKSFCLKCLHKLGEETLMQYPS